MPENETNSDDSLMDRGANTSGCCVFAAIVTIFGGLVILYVTIYFVQRNLYEGFTQDAPVEIRLLEPNETQESEVRAKLDKIKVATENDDQVRVMFTAEDLNVMIATMEPLKDFRGNTYVDAITNRGIEANMSQAIRRMPLTPGAMHLNATFVLWPELRRRTIAMRVADIIPVEGKVPEGFVESFDSMSMMRFDPDNPVFKNHIPKIRRVYLEEPHLVVETGPPAEQQPLFNPKQ